MAQPAPDDRPSPHASIVISRFEWPSLDTRLPVPGMGFHLRLTNRHNGDGGIAPIAAPDETELGRFVVAYCRVIVPVDDGGRPASSDQVGPLREVCIGGGEVVLTEHRMCLVLIKGNGALGKVDDERGSVIAIDVPFRAVGSIALVREKKAFRGIKERQIRCYCHRPPGAIDIEPLARLPAGNGRPIRIGLTEFFEQLVQLACDDALKATLMEANERKRLQQVRDGARTVEDLDIVAEIVR